MTFQLVNKISESVFGRIWGFTFPPRCPVTGDPVDRMGLFSASGWDQLHFVTAPMCACCGLPFETPLPVGTRCVDCLDHPPAYDEARAPLLYDEACAGMLLNFKHGDHIELVQFLAPLMLSTLPIFTTAVDLVVPVPLHWRRLLARRYNQAAILTRAISRGTRIPMRPDALFRTRRTESQGHKTRAERQKNVRNAFTLNPAAVPSIQGKSILLVDDVMTTGATVDACAETLKQFGAARVSVLTLARVPKAPFVGQDLLASEVFAKQTDTPSPASRSGAGRSAAGGLLQSNG